MIVRALAIALTLAGLAGLLMPHVIGFAAQNPDALELPLTDVTDVALSADNHLFFALTFAGRVQHYTADGRFVVGFPVNAAGTRISIDIAQDRLLMYAQRRGNGADEHDLTGRLIRANIPFDRTKFGEVRAFDPQVEEIEPSFTATTVSFTDGRPSLRIERQLWHYAALHPLASWLLLVIGIVLWPASRDGLLSDLMRWRR